MLLALSRKIPPNLDVQDECDDWDKMDKTLKAHGRVDSSFCGLVPSVSRL